MWLRQDASWHRTPRARKAGPHGRAVYPHLVAIVKTHGERGELAAEFWDAAWLADEIGMPAEWVEAGLAGILVAGLVRLDDGAYQVADWRDKQIDPTAAERQAKSRKSRAVTVTSVTSVSHDDHGPVPSRADTVRSGPDSDSLRSSEETSAVAASEPAAPPASPRKRAPRAPKPPEERKRPEWVDEWSRWWSATWPEYHNGQPYRFESAHDGKALVGLGDRYRPEDIGALQAAVVWAWRGTDYHAGRASTHWRFLAAAGELLGLSTRSAPSRNGTGPSHEPTEDELVAAMVAEAHERAERKRTARGATP